MGATDRRPLLPITTGRSEFGFGLAVPALLTMGVVEAVVTVTVTVRGTGVLAVEEEEILEGVEAELEKEGERKPRGLEEEEEAGVVDKA